MLEPVDPFPDINKWSQRQFASDSYNFLCKIIKDREEGEVFVDISGHKILHIFLNKSWGLRPYAIN